MLLFFIACGESKDTGSEEVVNYNEGPTLSLEIPEQRYIEGNSLPITVSVSDTDGIAEVVGYYRKKGNVYWDQSVLWEGTSANTDETLELEIPVTWAPTTEIYIKAVDAAASPAYTLYPENGAENPLEIDT